MDSWRYRANVNVEIIVSHEFTVLPTLIQRTRDNNCEWSLAKIEMTKARVRYQQQQQQQRQQQQQQQQLQQQQLTS
ncbi:hypothetical protein HZH68_009669 [Vespula germanica]|uniref:Uncharacterized protein n=1 Tax=Vespula germanica TaxID=30212 RepID=A0A834JVU0_VESGE|nr:hypothetical protein HZH68_009669 [Vespula germanica]